MVKPFKLQMELILKKSEINLSDIHDTILSNTQP